MASYCLVSGRMRTWIVVLLQLCILSTAMAGSPAGKSLTEEGSNVQTTRCEFTIATWTTNPHRILLPITITGPSVQEVRDFVVDPKLLGFSVIGMSRSPFQEAPVILTERKNSRRIVKELNLSSGVTKLDLVIELDFLPERHLAHLDVLISVEKSEAERRGLDLRDREGKPVPDLSEVASGRTKPYPIDVENPQIPSSSEFSFDPGLDLLSPGSLKNGLSAQFKAAGPGFVKAGPSRVDRFEVSGTIPLFKPRDAEKAGAKASASGELADTLTASYSIVTYRSQNLAIYGLRLRSTADFKGREAAAYYQPLLNISRDNRSLIGAEIEAGWRDGDAEWESLTTLASPKGNFVGRAAIVAEWIPRLGGVNADPNAGLRFFVRGRGWFDSFDKEAGGMGVRFRPYLDSEIFYSFSKSHRIFLRGEFGYLPPDLSRLTRRVTLGIGTAW
jgi:hypothetical protein